MSRIRIALAFLCLVGFGRGAASSNQSEAAEKEGKVESVNKATVERYMEGFRKSDHAQILSCLTDDVEWEVPGAFRLQGKAAFDKEIENPAFESQPTITITRLTEENDVVVAEGMVETRKKAGGVVKLRMCDVFEMREGKIKRLVSYLMEVK